MVKTGDEHNEMKKLTYLDLNNQNNNKILKQVITLNYLKT